MAEEQDSTTSEAPSLLSGWYGIAARAVKALRGRRPARARSSMRRLRLQPLEPRQLLAANVFVDDSWAGTLIGADPDPGDSVAMQFGIDAFALIQDGVNAVEAGGKVEVRPGTYAENVIIPKSLELYGTDRAAVVVQPSFVGADVAGGSLGDGHSTVFLVQANDVEIHHLTVDGDNSALTSGIVRDGADVDARNGINTDHNTVSLITGLEVHHTTVRNTYLRGIQSGTDFGTFDFHDNTVTNVAGEDGSIAIFNFGGSGTISNNLVSLANDAIAANWSVGTTIIGNQVSNSLSGIHTDNAGGYGAPSVPDLIRGNTVTDGAGDTSYGIFTFASYSNPLIKDNIVTDVLIGLAAFGDNGGTPTFELNQVSNSALLPGSVGAFVSTSVDPFGSLDTSANFINNTIRDVYTGIHAHDDGSFAASISVTGGSITGSMHGIALDGGSAVISGVTIQGNSVGVDFASGASGSVTGVDFDGATDNLVDLRLSSLTGAVGIGGGNQFAGDALYINLDNAQSYDLSSNGTAFDESSNFRIEDKIRHRMDIDQPLTNGLVTWATGNVYVTAPAVGSTDSSIQRGADVASNGDVVNIEAGMYTEQVEISKPVTLQGSGPATVIKSPSALGSTFSIGTTDFFPVVTVEGVDATVRDLTIDGDGNGSHVNDRFVGLAYYNAGGTADNLIVTGVRHDPLDGLQNGLAIYARNSTAMPRNLTISDSVVREYQKNGITVAGENMSVDVLRNTITGAGDTTSLAQNGIQVAEGAVANILDNVISGHQYSGVDSGGDALTGTQASGVLLMEAGAGTIVDDNDINGNDIGVYSWGAGLTISNNRLGQSAANRFEGILVDEGITDVTGNTINGGNVGVLVVSFDGNSLDSDAALSGNLITGARFGIQAIDGNTADGVQPILNSSDDTITGSTAAGVLLADANSIIVTANIQSSTAGAVGIEVAGGRSLIQNSDLSGNYIGLRVRDDARVDAGDTASSNSTGLGSSTGNNDLTGYTGTGGNYAIQNLNLVASSNFDVLAQNNFFGPLVTASFIEPLIFDDSDDASRTDVVFTPAQSNNIAPQLANVVITASADENGVVTLSGKIIDPNPTDSFALVVNWGEGAQQTFNYGPGTTSFSESHHYLDDNPTGTASDTYNVELALTDSSATGELATVTTTINNVAPAVTINPREGPHAEGAPVTLTSTIVDPGTQDKIDYLWSVTKNGMPYPVAGNTGAPFTFTPDDNAIFEVTLQVNDDDLGASSDTVTLIVNSVAPVIELVADAAVDAGSPFTQSGSFTDPGADSPWIGTVDYDYQGAGDSDAVPLTLNPNKTFNLDHTFTEPGTYVVRVTVTEDNGSGATSFDEVIVTVVDVTPPQVTSVGFGSTFWSPSFKSAVGPDGFFQVPAGAQQLKTLPWTNINQIRVTFSEHVDVQERAFFDITGVNNGTFSFTGFAYDPLQFAATWTLASPMGIDKVRVLIDEQMIDATGNALDGDWTDSTSAFPSGDGTAGGDFRFRANLLPGDVNRSGVVTASDVTLVFNSLFSVVGDANYSVFADVNGSGNISSTDLTAVFNAQFTSLPSGEPLSQWSPEEVFALLGADKSPPAAFAPAPVRFAVASSRVALADKNLSAVKSARQTSNPQSTATRDVLAALGQLFEQNDKSAQKWSLRAGRFWRAF